MLELQIAISGYQNFKARVSTNSQQIAVFESSPAQLGGELAILAAGTDGNIGNRSYFDVEAQVRQTMLNVKGALEGVGASFKDLVRLDTYVVITVMNEYKRVGVRVKHDMLAGVRVSGATVYVSALQPTAAMIEISAIAAVS